jgi:hypothetical protein
MAIKLRAVDNDGIKYTWEERSCIFMTKPVGVVNYNELHTHKKSATAEAIMLSP